MSGQEQDRHKRGDGQRGGGVPSQPGQQPAHPVSGAGTDAPIPLGEEPFCGRVDAVGGADEFSVDPAAFGVVAEGSSALGDEPNGATTGREVAYGLLRTLRESDLACRLDNGRFGLLLDETAADGAVLTVDRFRSLLDEQGTRHHLWAGVSTYPTHALDSTSLLLAADAALKDAMAWRQSRIELAVVS